jgi:hypothetical protein
MRGDHRAAGIRCADARGPTELLDAEIVARYTWPELVEDFDEFPRTPSLKVLKRDVVATILQRAKARP